MSTPASGNADNDRRGASADGSRNADQGRSDNSNTSNDTGTSHDSTEMLDTGGSGASSAGRADRGSGDRGRSGDQGGGYVPGAYSADEDTSGDYVPGMYSGDDDSSRRASDTTPTREQDRAPVSATRDDGPRTADHSQAPTQAHTQVVPVSASKRADDDGGSGTRQHRLPRGAAGTTDQDTGSRSGVPTLADRKLLHQREKEHFGGMKLGAGFFGWLTATGMFVLLSALVGGIAALSGLGGNLSTSDLSSGSAEAQTTGITAAVVLGVILLLSYFTGGYVAGRMARFSGVKQGIAVWLWALIVAVVLAVIGLIVGNQGTVTERFQGLGVPSVQDLAGPGLIGLLVVAAVALIGAILGGLAGMRYHRKIDRTDFEALDDAA